jgi:DNA modification methylase
VSSTFCLKCHAWRGVLGNEPTPDLYIQHLVGIFDLVKRVLKPTGTIFVNLGDAYQSTPAGNKEIKFAGDGAYGRLMLRHSQGGTTEMTRKPQDTGIPAKSLIGIPARFQLAMIEHGWICRNEIVWWKRSCMPESTRDRFTRDWEHIFFFSAKKDYYFEQQFEPVQINFDRTFEGNGLGADERKALEMGGRAGSTNPLGRNARTVWHGNEPLPYRLKDTIPKEQLDWLLKTFCEAQTVPQGDVWDVTSQGTNLEHYASYPSELCRRPILAGCPEYICPKCGKAREKVYSREVTEQLEEHPYYGDGQLRANGTAGDNGGKNSTLGGQQNKIKSEFIGYSDCGCQIDGKPIPLEQCVPGVVLDCFAGTGSTGVMAKMLGRKSILIDVSESYCNMMVEQLKSLQGVQKELMR